MNPLQYPFNSAFILQKKRALKKELIQKKGLINKKVALVCGSTLGEISKILELFLLNGGINPSFYEGGYGLFYENIVFDDGSMQSFAPDIIYIHTSNRNIRFWPTPSSSPAQVEKMLDEEFAYFEAVWQAAKKFGCPVIQNNFELPVWRNFGNMDASDVRGRTNYVNRLNQRMAQYAQQNPNFYIHDLAYLAARFGLENWCDTGAWYAYKYACGVNFIPQLAHSLANLIKSLFGISKKSVVLDLDNTLWGGVIGELGAENIEIGSETPLGLAYWEFQLYLKNLAQRGILLNVASKNEQTIAQTGFAREESPLKRSDFLCFEANWEPKSRNMAKMAETLNISADSFVFMDDNPAERELVRQEMPGITVPELTAPEDAIGLIDAAGYFEVSMLSADDVKRGEMYRQNAQRQQLQTNFGNYEDYLRGLCMQAEIKNFTPQHLERITQLINKTNQFNLTTRRYTLAQANQCMQSSSCICLAARLTDKFGDNGLTSVIIGSINGDVLNIDLWVMSCRVFKRHFEYAMFDALVGIAKKRGIKKIKASWLATAKNLLVKDFYATIGFALTQEGEQQRLFEYTLPENYEGKNQVIEVNQLIEVNQVPVQEIL